MDKTMVRVLLLMVLVLSVFGIAAAQQPPTKVLYVSLVTRTQAMPKMPGLPPGLNIPGLKIPGMGGPMRMISGRAVYSVKPVEPIYLGVPADLGLAQNRLILNVPKPGANGPAGAAGNEEGQPAGGTMEITTKVYWHPDQAKGPITDTMKVAKPKANPRGGPPMPNLDPAMLAELDKTATGSTTKLPANVKGLGDYICNTGGMATLDGFLPALNVTQPASMDTVKPEDGFTLKWDAVTGARGYLISVMSMKSEGDENNSKMNMTSWFSTLVEPPMRVRGSYMPDTTIADDLKNGILLPGDTTSCVVPAGMFTTDYNMLTVRVEAIGNDFYSPANPIVHGTIRSEWTAMKMNMGNMGGDE